MLYSKVLPSARSLDNPRRSREPPGTGTRRTETLRLTDQTPWIGRSVETKGKGGGHFLCILVPLCCTTSVTCLISPIFSTF